LKIGIEGNKTLHFEGQTIQWSKEKKTTRGHEFKDIKGTDNTMVKRNENDKIF
jgi:hypothetical protein